MMTSPMIDNRLSTDLVVMSCEQFIANVTELLRSFNEDFDTSRSPAASPVAQKYYVISDVIHNYIVPAICIFGVVGNLLNLIVLTRKRLQRSMKDLERSVTNGLAMLAMSDMMYCIANYILYFVRGNKTTYDSKLEMYVQTYKETVINIFLLMSTWLTVILALGRYIAVCRPLHARWFINMRGTRLAITSVCIGSFVLNIPSFWRYYPSSAPCSHLNLPYLVAPDAAVAAVAYDHHNFSDSQSQCHCSYNMKLPGDLFRNTAFTSVYHVTWAVIAILVPVSVLVVCNWCLVRALRRSSAMQQRCCVKAVGSSLVSHGNQGSSSSPGHRITPTLIALIVFFVVLVVPAEILTLLRDILPYLQHPAYDSQGQGANSTEDIHTDSISDDLASDTTYLKFQLAADVTNCLLLVNFAFNVVLYCAINAHFRRVMKYVVCWVILRRRRQNNASLQGSGTEAATIWRKSTQNYRTTADVDIEMTGSTLLQSVAN